MHADVMTPQAPDAALLRGLFDANGDAVAVMDLNGKVVCVNTAARAAGLCVSAQPTDPGWVEWWDAEDQAAAAGAIERARRGGIGRIEAQRPDPGGGLRFWHATVTSLRDSDDGLTRLLAICHDVTEMRQELESSKRRIDALVAATAEVVWRSDPLQRTGDVEGQRFRYRGWESEESEGWLESLHPDDRAATRANARRGVATGTAYVNEYRLRDRSGDWRWVEDRVVPVTDRHGAVTEWVGVVSDIHDRRTAQEALRESEERLRLAVTASGVGVWDVDLLTGSRTWSSEMKGILGLPANVQASEAAFLDRIHPDDRAIVETAHRELFLQSSGSPSISFRIVRADDGETRWVTSCGRAMLDESGRPVRRLGTMQDITERRRAEREAQERGECLHAALRVGRMVIWDRDLRTGVVSRSENAEEILGNSREHVSDFLARVHPDDLGKVTWDSSVVPSPSSGNVQFHYRHPDGRDLWLETTAITVSGEGSSGRVVGITTDITAEKLAEAKLVYAATHDPLTGLLNRMAFGERLDQAMTAAAARGDRLHLLLIDVDSLKAINDSLGHDAGDAVLRLTAERLNAVTPAFGLVARLSGDEFAAVLDGDAVPEDATDFWERLVDFIADPMLHKRRPLAVGASVGIASFPDHATTTPDLMKNADLALYSAKRSGRRRAHVFRPEMRAAVEAVNSIKAEFRVALTTNQIVPFYQPKVDLATGAVVGFEALARWVHPERGLLTPAVFSPVFEDGSLALEVGAVMLDRVLQDVRSWLDRGLAVGRVALNTTGHEFRLADFAEATLRRLLAAGVPTRHFEIEVTEGVMLGRDADFVVSILRQLHRAGVKISLDDFGTGYASLVHLKMFPVDEIKIDRSFVAEVESEPNSAIVKAVIAMGRVLGLTVVAEGIETAAQADALLAMGCQQGQGHRFGKPMHAERVPWFVRKSMAEVGSAPAPFRSGRSGG